LHNISAEIHLCSPSVAALHFTVRLYSEALRVRVRQGKNLLRRLNVRAKNFRAARYLETRSAA